jgi:hypothetical protein
MRTFDNPFEQKLHDHLEEVEKMRKAYGEKVSSQKALLDVYTPALARLRELNITDARRGETSPKEFNRIAASASMEARQAIAFKAPTDGVAKAIMKNLPALALSREDALLCALLCIAEDCEQCFGFLGQAKLPVEDEELAVLAAIKHYPIFAYEEYKTQEVIYQTANTEDPREMQELQRRFEQAKGKKIQHVRKHVLNYIPEDLRSQMELREILIQASMERDAFGTLETLRDSAAAAASAPAPGQPLQSTTTNLLEGIPVEKKLELLEIAANLGLGLASVNLDLFAIPNDPQWHPKLQEILILDMTAGHSLFGAYALEGVHHYPFNLARIEPTLPRRITNAEAIEYLKRNEGENAKPRTYSSNEVAEIVTMLQEKDVRRFIENLKWNIGRGWKELVQDKKREIVFGDYDLKVRNILFLVAYSLFEKEEKFEEIYALVEKSHPILAPEPPKIYLLANRYYFLDLLGLNISFLFNRGPKASGSTGTLIEEVGDYQVRNFMHLGMSIYIRVGDAIFKDMSIAWTMLIGQCDNKIDTVFHEIGMLFDTFDTMLTIIDPVIHDMAAWVHTLVEALSQDAPSLPPEAPGGPKQAQLRVTTRATIARVREALNRYSLDALYLRAKTAGLSTISIIQTLKMPRSKTDKLMNLMQNDPNKGNR